MFLIKGRHFVYVGVIVHLQVRLGSLGGDGCNRGGYWSRGCPSTPARPPDWSTQVDTSQRLHTGITALYKHLSPDTYSALFHYDQSLLLSHWSAGPVSC